MSEHVRALLAARQRAKAGEVAEENDPEAGSKIREERDRLRSVFDYAADALLVHDHDGRFLEVNPFACQLLGYRREQLLKMSLADIEPDFDLFGIRERWSEMHLGQGVTVEGRPRHRDGEALEVEVRLSVIDDTPGARRYLAILRDLGQRKAPRDALRRSQQRFRQLVEHAGDPFFLLDPAGRIHDVNQRACEALAATRDQLHGATLQAWLRPATAQLPDAWVELKPGDATTLEVDLRAADGRRWPAEVSLSAVDWEGERLLLCFAHDITERVRQTRALARSNAELQQFARVASHDLQEPLRKIRTFAEMLIEDHRDQLDDDARAYLDIMVDGATRMRTLITDLLEFSRVGSEQAPAEPVDLAHEFEEVLWNLSVRLEQSGGHVEADPLPTVEGDASQLRRLLLNLVGNALKYCRPGVPPRVRIGAVEDDGVWTLRIEDNGIGFPPERAAEIFEPFRRLHGRSEYPGTGMGLAICLRIVERHQGSIEASSRPDEGSVFTVCLPARQPASAKKG